MSKRELDWQRPERERERATLAEAREKKWRKP